MRYYIKNTKGNLEVLDLKSNKVLEGSGKNIYSAVAKALSHAYMEYGEKIIGEGIKPPSQPVNIYYKEGWIDLNRITYKYGCQLYLHRLKKEDKEPSIRPVQLSLF